MSQQIKKLEDFREVYWYHFCRVCNAVTTYSWGTRKRHCCCKRRISFIPWWKPWSFTWGHEWWRSTHATSTNTTVERAHALLLEKCLLRDPGLWQMFSKFTTFVYFVLRGTLNVLDILSALIRWAPACINWYWIVVLRRRCPKLLFFFFSKYFSKEKSLDSHCMFISFISSKGVAITTVIHASCVGIFRIGC